MRVHSLFRAQHTTIGKSVPPPGESQRDVSKPGDVPARGVSAESWERARRWDSID